MVGVGLQVVGGVKRRMAHRQGAAELEPSLLSRAPEQRAQHGPQGSSWKRISGAAPCCGALWEQACVPCRKHPPPMQQLHRTFDQGLTIGSLSSSSAGASSAGTPA